MDRREEKPRSIMQLCHMLQAYYFGELPGELGTYNLRKIIDFLTQAGEIRVLEKGQLELWMNREIKEYCERYGKGKNERNLTASDWNLIIQRGINLESSFNRKFNEWKRINNL